ncbi:MAG: heme-binding protein [Nitrospirota bacterium]|nr:MAG: heme-binding protein [Nitrospirota bacterium]
MKRQLSFYTFTLLLIIFSGGCAGVSEEARFNVILKEGNFELREYEPQVVVETLVDGDFDEVGNVGFRRLFKYISGNNSAEETISMTAPVTQEKEGVKIPMTAPVTQEKMGEKYSITFLVPSKYTIETVPKPLDENVRIREVQGQLMAAITYSGTWGRKRYDKHKLKLINWMKEKGYEQVGEPVYARYNPPFTPWFLRRNEVLIPVNNGDK